MKHEPASGRPHPAAPRFPAAAAATLTALLVSPSVRADDTPAVLDAVQVVGESAAFGGITPPGQDATGSRYKVDKEGMEIFGAAGGTNPYTMVSGLPGVKVQMLDPYGLTSRIGGNKGMRVRGIAAWHGNHGTVDGLTLSLINPGPGYLQMFDMENLAGVTLAQGPVPSDQPAFFTSTGALDSQLLWPADKAGGTLSGAVGSKAFARSFARVDSGSFGPGNTRVAVSASDAHSDLWRGPGESSRENYMAAVATELGALTLKLLAANSNLEQNNYPPLTAAQAQNLDQYARLGYDATPQAGAYQNYYRYNQQAFDNKAVIGEAEYRFSPVTRASLKVYSFDEFGSSYDASGTNKVRQWLIDHDSHGLSEDLETALGSTRLKAGYNFSSQMPPGPPTAQKYYTATAAGLAWSPATANSTNQGWSSLGTVTGRHEFQSLYTLASRQFDKLQVEGGLRYFIEKMPSLAEYDKTGVGDLSYAAALAASSGVTVSVDGPTVHELLPYFGMRYAFSPALEGRLSAGRNIGPASFDIWNSNIKSLKPSQQALAQALWN
ncbi:MAG: Plug domain-containing protein, partial [Zoogloea sp.]|nr:Plug domain-containing protein [Zoogloea sp.]